MTRHRLTRRSLPSAVAAGALATTIALLGGSSSQASTATSAGGHGPVPAALAVPAGQVPVADLSARGVQVYQCTAGAWAFVEPVATLVGRSTTPPRRTQAAVHFRGPSWQSTADGSLVQGAALASSPVPGAIPQLLLRATVNRGEGIFGDVTYIQRLATRGGTAPAGTCTAGATTAVEYRALYRFFAPA